MKKPTYLWTDREIKEGDKAMLVFKADDIINKPKLPYPKMCVVPVIVNKADGTSFILDAYTYIDDKYVKYASLPANTISGILGRLIPSEW